MGIARPTADMRWRSPGVHGSRLLDALGTTNLGKKTLMSFVLYFSKQRAIIVADVGYEAINRVLLLTLSGQDQARNAK